MGVSIAQLSDSGMGGASLCFRCHQDCAAQLVLAGESFSKTHHKGRDRMVREHASRLELEVGGVAGSASTPLRSVR